MIYQDMEGVKALRELSFIEQQEIEPRFPLQNFCRMWTRQTFIFLRRLKVECVFCCFFKKVILKRMKKKRVDFYGLFNENQFN